MRQVTNQIVLCLGNEPHITLGHEGGGGSSNQLLQAAFEIYLL